MLKIFQSKDNLAAAATNLLKLLKVNVAETTITDILLSNSNYPSMLAISESLAQFKIVSEAFEITPDKLPLLPVPFIAHLKLNSGSFVTVTGVTEQHVTYLNDNGQKVKISYNRFLTECTNNILLAEATPESGQANYAEIRQQELKASLRLPIVVLSLIMVGAISIFKNRNFYSGDLSVFYWGMWMTTLLGILITSLFLVYDYDQNNSYLKSLCSISKKTNCTAVLNSKGSKFLGFSWGEIGFFYFLGTFIYLSINSYSPSTLNPLIILNLLAVPYIFYSLLYQALIVKQWCLLCLAVQTVIIINFLLSWLTGQVSVELFAGWDIVPYNHVFISYFVPVSLWMIIKPHLYKQKENLETLYNFRRFKNNIEIFNSLLQNQPAIQNNVTGLGIMLGNPNAENTLLKVCNPYCGPCAKSFPHLEDLLRLNGDNWNVQIIFTANGDKQDYRALPVAHFLAISETNQINLPIKTALADWYNSDDKDYSNYQKLYPVEFNFDDQAEKLNEMANWCRLENIEFTPAYFVNGRKLPEMYSLEDLLALD